MKWLRASITISLLLMAVVVGAKESQAAEFWVGSGWVYSGDRYERVCDDSICQEVDTRIRFPFEVSLVGGEKGDEARGYFQFGWINCYTPECSYTFVGAGVNAQPFNTDKFILQLGVEFGRETLNSDQIMRFRVCPMFAPTNNWRVGWCHRSNGRKLANLGNSVRNRPIEGLFFHYCITCKR